MKPQHLESEIMPPKQFSPERLKLAFEESGLRIERLAVAADVSSRTVQNWLDGRSFPSVDQLPALADVLKKPLGYFFESVEDR